jgi:hypothetical protein
MYSLPLFLSLDEAHWRRRSAILEADGSMPPQKPFSQIFVSVNQERFCCSPILSFLVGGEFLLVADLEKRAKDISSLMWSVFVVAVSDDVVVVVESAFPHVR